MSTLVVLASVFSLAGGGALVLRRRLEEALPLSVVLIVGVQYAFGLFGWLSAGFYAVLALCAPGCFAAAWESCADSCSRRGVR